jgi:hypothetical protein
MWPWEISGAAYPSDRDVSINDVIEIESSPTRLSAKVAMKISADGETGMGYYALTLLTEDGRGIPCISDNPDWVELPNGISPRQITDVIPHEGRSEARNEEGRPVALCLYRLS